MPEYKKIGYLTSSFKIFHLKDSSQREFHDHYHDFHKILILINGDITYCIEGRSYDLKPNDIVLVNAGEVHKPVLRSSRDYERIIIYLSPEFLNEYQEDSNDLGLCFRRAYLEQSHVLRLHSSRTGKLGSSILELDRSLEDHDYASELYQKVLFLEFMIRLNRAALHNTLTFIEESTPNEKILSILSYLNEHLTEDISIDTLSTCFYISRYYLMHTFKEQTGYTIGSYVSAKRLMLAKDLIAEGRPITEVCYACGFKNYTTFSRAYKKSFGESPREFRQSHT